MWSLILKDATQQGALHSCALFGGIATVVATNRFFLWSVHVVADVACRTKLCKTDPFSGMPLKLMTIKVN